MSLTLRAPLSYKVSSHIITLQQLEPLEETTIAKKLMPRTINAPWDSPRPVLVPSWMERETRKRLCLIYSVVTVLSGTGSGCITEGPLMRCLGMSVCTRRGGEWGGKERGETESFLKGGNSFLSFDFLLLLLFILQWLLQRDLIG